MQFNFDSKLDYLIACVRLPCCFASDVSRRSLSVTSGNYWCSRLGLGMRAHIWCLLLATPCKVFREMHMFHALMWFAFCVVQIINREGFSMKICVNISGSKRWIFSTTNCGNTWKALSWKALRIFCWYCKEIAVKFSAVRVEWREWAIVECFHEGTTEGFKDELSRDSIEFWLFIQKLFCVFGKLLWSFVNISFHTSLEKLIESEK